MDEYLSSLVKKEAIAEEPVVETVEEVVEEVTETVATEVVEEAKEEVAEEHKFEEDAIKEVKEDKKEYVTPEIKEEASQFIEGEEYDVKSVRVYRTPDTRQTSFTYSGRIIYLGKIGTFSIIKYMKHGFGLVQGYVNNMKEAIK